MDSPERLSDFATKYGLTYPQWRDPGTAALGKLTDQRVIPRTVVLDKEHRIVLRELGYTQEKFKQAGKTIESINVTALIDTGASLTIITPDVVKKLGLVKTGVQKISSVQDEQLQPVYFGFVIFPCGVAKEIPVVSCPLKGYECLIGRDILRHWHFTYHGVDGSVVICD